MALPLAPGFYNFAALDEGYRMQDPRGSSPKLSTSILAIKNGTPLILDSSTGTIAAAARQGTNEVQRINITNGGSVPTSGVSYLDWTPPNATAVQFGPIPYNATPAYIQQLIDNVVGPGNITVALVAGGGANWPTALTYYDFTFGGKYSGKNVNAMTASGNTMNNTGAMNIATQTAGVAGYATSATIVGFSHDWDAGGPALNYERLFPLPPNLEDPAGSSKQYLYSRAWKNRRFIGQYDVNYQVTQDLVGDSVDLAYNVTDDAFYVGQSANSAMLKIVEIPTESIGKYGGDVIFVVLDANIAQL